MKLITTEFELHESAMLTGVAGLALVITAEDVSTVGFTEKLNIFLARLVESKDHQYLDACFAGALQICRSLSPLMSARP